MNEYLTLLEGLTTRIAAVDAANKELENKLDAIITGATTKERYEARKAAAADIDKITAEMNKNQATKDILTLTKKLAVEMYAKTAANNFINACKAGAKNLIDTPMHYKKFKAAAAAALSDDNGIISYHYYTIKVNYPYYSPIGYYDITAFFTGTEGIITAADAEKATCYQIIPAAELEKIAVDAIQAKKEVDAIKEKAKKEVDAIREQFNNFYAINID